MDDGYGIQAPDEHVHNQHRKPPRYLVIIDSAGATIARLFLETREQTAEVDAATEQVALMTRGLTPARTAHLPEWDRALGGHSAVERAAAEVYTLTG
jgi:hypothetical protein